MQRILSLFKKPANFSLLASPSEIGICDLVDEVRVETEALAKTDVLYLTQREYVQHLLAVVRSSEIDYARTGLELIFLAEQEKAGKDFQPLLVTEASEVLDLLPDHLMGTAQKLVEQLIPKAETKFRAVCIPSPKEDGSDKRAAWTQLTKEESHHALGELRFLAVV